MNREPTDPAICLDDDLLDLIEPPVTVRPKSEYPSLPPREPNESYSHYGTRAHMLLDAFHRPKKKKR